MTIDNQSREGTDSGKQDEESQANLKEHIAKLEAELARYASKYGLSDTARQLLVRRS